MGDVTPGRSHTTNTKELTRFEKEETFEVGSEDKGDGWRLFIFDFQFKGLKLYWTVIEGI